MNQVRTSLAAACQCCMKIRRAKIALIFYLLFLISLVFLADEGKGKWMFALTNCVPWGDKLGHFILFGILSFLINLLLRAQKTTLFGFSVMKGSTIIMAIVTLEECSQRFFLSRTFDFVDLTADAIGIWFFARLAAIYLRHRQRCLNCRL